MGMGVTQYLKLILMDYFPLVDGETDVDVCQPRGATNEVEIESPLTERGLRGAF